MSNPCQTNVDVLKAKSSMTDLLQHKEHCWMDPDLASNCSILVGDQIRLKRNSSEYALYTVTNFYEDGSDNDDTRIAKAGRKRLGTSNSIINIDLFTDILRSDLTDADAETQSEFVERLTDDGSHTGLIACAPHGGKMEDFTDEQAERLESQLAAKSVSSWRCKGWKSGGGAFSRWHITSTDISRRSFPLLDSVADRGFQHAVSFHGFSGSEILVGGAASDSLKDSIVSEIQTALSGSGITVRKATSNDPVNGDDPDNFVNWLSGQNGIQIEQSLTARQNYWQDIADAVATVYDSII